MLDDEVTKEAYGDIREADGIFKGRLEGEKLGWLKGEKAGRLKGEKAGRLQGEKVGRLQGEKAKALEAARNFKREGVDIALIAKCVGLSIEEIEAL